MGGHGQSRAGVDQLGPTAVWSTKIIAPGEKPCQRQAKGLTGIGGSGAGRVLPPQNRRRQGQSLATPRQGSGGGSLAGKVCWSTKSISLSSCSRVLPASRRRRRRRAPSTRRTA